MFVCLLAAMVSETPLPKCMNSIRLFSHDAFNSREMLPFGIIIRNGQI